MSLRKIIITFLLVFPGFMELQAAQPGMSADINDLKAVFIFNFTKYITWPERDVSEVFRIGVIGDSRIINSLKQLAAKKTIDDKAIIVQYFADIQSVSYCHILFVSDSHKHLVGRILEKLSGWPTLTISDSAGLCQKGIMINFYLKEGMIKFELNPGQAEKSGLKVSSQLQKLALIVE